MATRTFGQDFNALGRSAGESIAAVGAFIGDGVKGMTPLGRRSAVTAVGAVLALGLGAATASAFRLPSEITDPSQPQDQVLAQSELPSETAARTYALENPPTYTVNANHAEDASVRPDPLTVITAPQDDPAPISAVYTTNSDDQPEAAKPVDASNASPATAADPNS